MSLEETLSKARRELGWKPKVSFKQLVKSMVEKDIAKIKTSNQN